MRLGLVAVTLASLTSVASAGTYLGIGVGSESTGGWDGAAGEGTMEGYGRSGRLMVGMRFARLSIEGQGSRFDLAMNPASTFQANQVAAAVKLSLPLGSNFEFFGKGGLARTWLTNSSSASLDAAGNGLLFGAGFEYRLNLAVTAVSIFVDYQRASTAFTSESMATWDGVTSMWTLGATVSL